MSSALAPVDERERIVTIDVLRGLALCGVLIANLFRLYSGRWLAAPAADAHATVLDGVARVAMQVLVEGKAQNLLTFLFGFGFATQMLRAADRGQPVARVHVRRMLALLLLGWCHVALLWWGDVTWGYALCGFALLGIDRVPRVVRVVLAIALITLPYAAWVQWKGGPFAAALVGFTPDDARRWTAELQAAMAGGWADYPTLVWNHMRYALLFSAPIWLWYYPALIGRFWLGYVAGAGRWFVRDGAERLPLFRRFAWLGALVGAPLAALRLVPALQPAMRDVAPFVTSLLYTIELLAMAAMYIGVVVLLVQRPRWRRVLAVVAPAGRMPLSTYVLQSVICTFLFYGWGLGWRTPGAAACLGLGLAIFVVQIVLARRWLRSFRTGPLEYVWRRLVYGRPQALRR